MANPTNINVPPALAADPTNINVPVHGTKFPSGITGSDDVIVISQKSDLGNGVTAVVADSFTAPYRMYIRSAQQMNYSLAATMSYSLYNSTQAIDVVASNTPTTNTTAEATIASTAARLVEQGDVIQLLVTTSGGAGAVKGLSVRLFVTQLAGSTTNPL